MPFPCRRRHVLQRHEMVFKARGADPREKALKKNRAYDHAPLRKTCPLYFTEPVNLWLASRKVLFFFDVYTSQKLPHVIRNLLDNCICSDAMKIATPQECCPGAVSRTYLFGTTPNVYQLA